MTNATALNSLLAEDRATSLANEINAHLPDDYRDALQRQSLADSETFARKGVSRRVMLVGGAGYIGTVVTRHFLERGYSVKCMDNLIYGHGFTVLPFLTHPNYEFVNTDIRATDEALAATADCTDIVILAGLVGDPITKKYPEASEEINSVAIREYLKGLQRLHSATKVVFVSTCSNYGLIEDDQLATETHDLNPLSLYAKSKVEIEKQLLSEENTGHFIATVLRFATAFGYSPRMRFDLTVSEFIRDLYLGKELVVYDADTWRPYCHVEDFAELIRRVIEAPAERTHRQVFNAGGISNNLTKRTIVETVVEAIPGSTVTYQEHGSDPRNYRVDFTKVRETLHFDVTRSLTDGIDELRRVLELGFFTDSQVSGHSLNGNYQLVAA